MTVALILPDRIVSDSKLAMGTPHTVGKIFAFPGGGLYVTAGDSRLTDAFEKSMSCGAPPEALDTRPDESFEAAFLRPDGHIVLFDSNFAGFEISERWTAIGSGGDVARSWFRHAEQYGLTPEQCIERVFEVREDCGPPVVTVFLHPQKPKRGKKR